MCEHGAQARRSFRGCFQFAARGRSIRCARAAAALVVADTIAALRRYNTCNEILHFTKTASTMYFFIRTYS